MYTRAEKTRKTHTVADALKAAECILGDKRIRVVNTTQIGNRAHTELITIAELNVLADALVSDTLFSV